MKLKIALTALLGLAIVTGCSSEDKKDGESVQKIIDTAGWEINEPSGGEIAKSIELIISPSNQFTISYDNEKKKVTSVSFLEDEDDGQYFVNYDGTKTERGLHVGSDALMSCNLYDLTKNEEDTRANNNYGKCSTTEVEALQEAVKSRDEYLSKYELSLADLDSWGNWYFNK